MRERKSRFLIALKNENRSPTTITNNLIGNEKLKSMLKVKSITFDNDISFTKHEYIAAEFGAKTYFCDPFKSYQKGSIENANRVLRKYCPRDIDINALQQEEINTYTDIINNTPMKCLDYKTPEEVYWKLTGESIRNKNKSSVF